MIYLSRFTFPSQERESFFFHEVKRKCYDSFYPFGVVARFDPTVIEFEPVTILYGGNGTGKSTALTVIAQKLHLTPDAPLNETSFYADYVDICTAELRQETPSGSRIVTGDDVFPYILTVRDRYEAKL